MCEESDTALIQLNKPLQNLTQNWNETFTAISTYRSTTSNPLCLQQSVNERLQFTAQSGPVIFQARPRLSSLDISCLGFNASVCRGHSVLPGIYSFGNINFRAIIPPQINLPLLLV